MIDPIPFRNRNFLFYVHLRCDIIEVTEGAISMSSKALFHVTVKGIVAYEGKLLLLKKVKPSKDNYGYWELPGGGMEYNESPMEAVKREVLEETGLEVDVEGAVSTFHVVRKDKEIVGIIFLCYAKNNEVKLSAEHTEYVFVTQEETKDYLAQGLIDDTFGGKVVCLDGTKGKLYNCE